MLCTALAACGDEGTPADAQAGRGPEIVKSAASVRATRRPFDGAPPVIPHAAFGAACTQCHNERGMEVAGLGFAPPSPHEFTAGLSALSRCEQCHAWSTTTTLFRESSFVGLRQDLRRGNRLYPGAPPVIPHLVQMRENCQACHAGPAVREEIRCGHAERTRCQQCHVPVIVASDFERR
jgi:cytochrome c-type protein NapB